MSVTEQFANTASSTLTATIGNSDTSLTVASAALFPSVPQFRITVDSEIMLVTAVAGAVFTVTRGIESTAAATHLSGATVTHLLTAGALAQFRSDNINSGTYANLPAAGTAGRLYFQTDGPYCFRDNGSAWLPFGPIFPLTVPIDANYSWVNQGGATTSSTNGTVVLTAPTSVGKNARMRVRAAPVTPYKITALFSAVCEPANYFNYGLVLRNSSSGKWIGWQFTYVNGFYLTATKFTDPNTYSADYKTVLVNTLMQTGMPLWLRLYDDGTNRNFQYSFDGFSFYTWYSVINSDFITPDQVGWYANTENSNSAIMATLHSWTQA